MHLLIKVVWFIIAVPITAIICGAFAIKLFDDWVRGDFPYPPFDQFRKKYGK